MRKVVRLIFLQAGIIYIYTYVKEISCKFLVYIKSFCPAISGLSMEIATVEDH